jgi:hypothetical protein
VFGCLRRGRQIWVIDQELVKNWYNTVVREDVLEEYQNYMLLVFLRAPSSVLGKYFFPISS